MDTSVARPITVLFLSLTVAGANAAAPSVLPFSEASCGNRNLRT